MAHEMLPQSGQTGRLAGRQKVWLYNANYATHGSVRYTSEASWEGADGRRDPLGREVGVTDRVGHDASDDIRHSQ
jgi:hypothetical protein